MTLASQCNTISRQEERDFGRKAVGIMRKSLIGCGLAYLMSTAALANDPMQIELKPGESPQFALLRSQTEARAAQLRAAWIAAGHAIPPSAPVITSGKILTPTIKTTVAPAAPRFSVTFSGSTRLSSVEAVFSSNSTAQELEVEYTTVEGTPSATSGTIVIEQPGRPLSFFSPANFTLYSAAGTWTLSYLLIADTAGNTNVYNENQIATLFGGANTITVTNPASPDTSAPLVSAGKILTPTVHIKSATPAFGAQLTVSDNLSGAFFSCVYIEPPGGTFSSCYDNFSSAPILSGNLHTWDYIGSTGTTGTWTITGYEVCDAATNCLIVLNNASAVKALFGTTTFTVTN
jgi:hypothetical protein